MFARKKKYPSGNIGVIVVEKIGGKMKEFVTIGVAYSEDEVENLVNEAKEWISKKNPGAIHNSIYMVRSVKRVTVKKSSAFCPMSAISFSTDAT